MTGKLVNKITVGALVIALAVPLPARGQVAEAPVATEAAAFDAVIPATLRQVIAAERKKPAMVKAIERMELFAAELGAAPEGTQPRAGPDPFHLTAQYLSVYDKKNLKVDRYHLVGIEKGLPRVVPQPDAIRVENVGGHLGFRYAHAVHSIESVKPHIIAADTELVVVVDKQGEIFVIDYVFAKRELLRGLVPVHRISFRVGKHSQELSGLRLTFITRGLQPFTHKLVGGAIQPLRDNTRFTAGDLAVWQQVDDKKILLEVVARQVLIAEVNANNYLLGSIAYMVRADKPQEISRALQLQRQQKFNNSDVKEIKAVMASSDAMQNLQKMSPDRVQKIVMGGVANNNYRDSFTYARWQRDYLIVRDQAERTIVKLEQSANKKYKIIKDRTAHKQMQSLKDQLRAGNFGASWIMLSTKYIEDAKELVVERILELKQHHTKQARQQIAVLEDILRKNDYQRLWDEPQLFADLNKPRASPFRAKVKRYIYKHLNREMLQDIGLSVLGVGGVVGLAAGAAWVIKGGFTLSSIVPEVLRRKTYPNLAGRRHLLYGMGIFALTIPTLAALGFLTARATGREWSFKKQLTLMGIRTDAWLSLPFWHHIANWSGQKTLLPALAAEISPFTKISGESLIGQTIGLHPEASLRVGFDSPNNAADGEFVNRRALILLQEQRVRAQAIGWELAADILFKRDLQRKLQTAGGHGQQALLSAINAQDFRDRWKKLATVLEAEVFQLHQDGVFFDLREVTKKHVYNFLRKTKPQVLDPNHHKNIFAQSASYLKKATARVGKFLAEGGTERIYFLQHADPDEFVSSFNWGVFWVDYVTVIVWEGLWGARAQLSEPSLLFAQRKFPWTHPHMQSDLVNQIAKRQIKDNGQLSLIFQLLQKIEEKNYTPMEEILYAGANGKENFFQGLYNQGKNSVDFRNVDYGGNFMEALMATVATLQSTFILAMLFRVMLAKVPVAKAVPQIALLLSWSMWAFSFPWFILASVTKLRDTKRDMRNEIFMRTKVNLQKAIAARARDDIAQEYRHLTTIYQSSKTRLPQALLASLRQVEDSLGISKRERLSPEDLYPYLALLLKIHSHDDVVVQRELYRRLVKLSDDNAEYEVSVADAEAMMRFSLQYPPFAKRSNGAVDALLLWTVAIVTTYLGGYFFRDSFREGKQPTKLLGFLEQVHKNGKLKTKLSRRGMIVLGVPLYFLLYLTLGKENYRRIEDKIRALLHLGEASGPDY